jgi:hypothetical protein
MEHVAGLAEILEQQSGLVTRGQLRALGITPGAVRWALGTRWRAVLPSVISTTGIKLAPTQRLVAALLHAGEGAALAGATAAAWHGVTAAVDDRRVHVQVPDVRHPRDCGFVVVRRVTHPDDACWVRGPLTVCSRPRAVVDAAREARSADQARAIVLEAVERRLVTPESLRHELEAVPRRGRAQVRQAVDEAQAGAWSVPEADLLRLLASSRRLPPVEANPVLVAADGTRLPIPDAWIDDVALAVQVHSRRWHAGALDWERTVMADGVFAEYGVVVVGVTPTAIRTAPEVVLTRVERAYRAAAARPRPLVVARPRQCAG